MTELDNFYLQQSEPIRSCLLALEGDHFISRQGDRQCMEIWDAILLFQGKNVLLFVDP